MVPEEEEQEEEEDEEFEEEDEAEPINKFIQMLHIQPHKIRHIVRRRMCVGECA